MTLCCLKFQNTFLLPSYTVSAYERANPKYDRLRYSDLIPVIACVLSLAISYLASEQTEFPSLSPYKSSDLKLSL